MGLIRRKTSKAVERKKAHAEEGGVQKPGQHKILTAEGWKRLMLGKSRKSSTKSKS